jgi:hypothetical protein
VFTVGAVVAALALEQVEENHHHRGGLGEAHSHPALKERG